MSSYSNNGTLAGYLSRGRLSHAILLESADPEARLKAAREIARYVMCKSGKAPCGACSDCIKIDKDIHPDLTTFSGGDRSRSFHVDAVREIRRGAYIKPNEAKAKVFILENAQNMTAGAQNALLKIIEEPPEDTAFILTCDNKASLLETVLSRVSSFTVGGEGPETSGGASENAAAIVDALLKGDELSAMALFSQYERDRSGFERLFNAVRAEASGRLTALLKQNVRITDEKADRLLKIAETCGELKIGLSQNAGGLIMTAMLSSKLYQSLRRLK